MHHRTAPTDDHHHGWVILPRISLKVCHILVRLVSSDLPRRCSRSDKQICDLYVTYYPADMVGTVAMGLTSMAFIHRWQLSWLSKFISYFAYIKSFPGRTCIVGLLSKAFMLWRTESRLSYFDSYFTYYPKDMAETWIIGLTLMVSTYWSLSSLLRDFTSYFPYFTSYPRQASITGLASKAYTLWWTKWRLKYFDHTCEPLLMNMREIWFSFQGDWRLHQGDIFDGIFNASFQTFFNKVRKDF